MSDLSWLNPTPHAIAVYASQPLSPVATQHSLPSGRYSLLGPDFHRLDRTSFAWRTHSITSSAAACSVSRNGQAEPSRGPEIDDQLEFRRLLDRQVCRLRAVQDFSRVDPNQAIRISDAGAIAHQPSRGDEVRYLVNGGKPMLRRQRNDLITPAKGERSAEDNERVGALLS